MLNESRKEFVTNYDLGLIYLGMKQESLALDYFKKAHDDQDAWISFIDLDPRFNYLSGNPGFQQITLKSGISVDWVKKLN
jgi:hypothetical protein